MAREAQPRLSAAQIKGQRKGLGAGWVQKMAGARGAAGSKKYLSKLPVEYRPSAEERNLFLGGAGDPEWDKAQRASLLDGDQTQAFKDWMYGEKDGPKGQYTGAGAWSRCSTRMGTASSPLRRKKCSTTRTKGSRQVAP